MPVSGSSYSFLLLADQASKMQVSIFRSMGNIKTSSRFYYF